MENTSAVSVIATVLNEEKDIDRLVDSLMRQTLVPAEVTIVDGGSADGTWEKLEAAKARYENLTVIRDETCRLPYSRGPISRGRNVAIAASRSKIVACVDAGCAYGAEWLENLTASIRIGESEYALGGSCIDPDERTIWDIASAPFFGVKLSADAKTNSCTARSMAFRKELWQRVGGFPEEFLFGEDTVFDLKARTIATPTFVIQAKALYRPRHTLMSALRLMARYALSDGIAGVRRARLIRNLTRCIAPVAAFALLHYSVIPLLCVLVFEFYTAFRLDWRDLSGVSSAAIAARIFFSLLVPWVVAWNQVKGISRKRTNP